MTNHRFNRLSAIKLLSTLVSQKTVTGNRKGILSALTQISQILPSERYASKILSHHRVDNLYLTSKSSRNKILLHGHIDVVPGSDSQFKLTRQGKLLFGRGVLDMKGALVVMLQLLQNTSGYDLLITGDEESGGANGTKYLVQSKMLLPYEYVITGEPTDLAVATQEKGVLWADLIFKGKSAHAAKPWEGSNPLFRLNDCLSYLREQYIEGDRSWHTTVVPSLVKSTNTQNQVPAAITLGIDCRFVPTDDPKCIQASLKNHCDQLKIDHLEPPLKEVSSPFTDILLSLTKKPATHMPWATDARFFTDIPAVIYGPKGTGMHAALESVEVDSLNTMYDSLIQLSNHLR